MGSFETWPGWATGIVTALLMGGTVLLVLWLINLIDSSVSRFLARFTPRRNPEAGFIVRLSDTEVVCERPDGKVERVAWDALQSVEVITTSDGPMSPDVFWLLLGTTGGCAIPQGATGDQELLHRLQDLPGFDNGMVIKAMGCATDARFLCWQRPLAATAS